jgi:hypothetical protein
VSSMSLTTAKRADGEGIMTGASDLDRRVACRRCEPVPTAQRASARDGCRLGQRQAEGKIAFFVGDCLPSLCADGRCHLGSGHLVRGEPPGHGIEILPAGISSPADGSGWLHRTRPLTNSCSAVPKER